MLSLFELGDFWHSSQFISNQLFHSTLELLLNFGFADKPIYIRQLENPYSYMGPWPFKFGAFFKM